MKISLTAYYAPYGQLLVYRVPMILSAYGVAQVSPKTRLPDTQSTNSGDSTCSLVNCNASATDALLSTNRGFSKPVGATRT